MADSSSAGLPEQALCAELLAFERLLAELITKYVDLPADRVEAEIEAELKRLIEFLGFDRGSFAELTADGGLKILRSVAVAGVDPMPLGPFPEQLQWYTRTINAGEKIVMHQLPEDLPSEAAAERAYVQRTGIRSHVSIPLNLGEKIFGAIGFAAFRGTRTWHPELIGRLKMVGDVLASALARGRAEIELRDADRQLQQLRTDLWHADRAESAGALTGSLAHELNQPLTAILSNAQAALRFLDRGDADDCEIRDSLEAIVRENKRAGAVIRGLRAMLRREEGERANVDLADAFGEVLLLLRGELERYEVRVETRFEERCAVLADRTQMQQVALNLIKNALEAMQSQPRHARQLHLAVAHDRAERVRVTVRDSGVGIAPDKLASVFQPFGSTKEQGMGLGLSIVRGIVEAHGGAVGVERNPDCGVTFAFSLPAAQAHVPHEVGVGRKVVPKCEEQPAEPMAAAAVWVVDDDPGVREGLRRLLAAAGFAVEVFASPREFLQRPLREVADCMLLDVFLPEMSGPELYARLRELGMSIPVIFLTGQGEVPTGIEAMKQGAVDYLLKPVDGEVLLRTVHQAVKRHSADVARRHQLQTIEARLDRLSVRERDVLDRVVRGRLNKQIAAELGISEKTVKQHRGRVMEKMEARSVADLVRWSEAVDAAPDTNAPS